MTIRRLCTLISVSRVLHLIVATRRVETDSMASAVHPTMLKAAAAAYTCTVDRYVKAGDAAEEGSIAKMGRAHPYFSPALGK